MSVILTSEQYYDTSIDKSPLSGASPKQRAPASTITNVMDVKIIAFMTGHTGEGVTAKDWCTGGAVTKMGFSLGSGVPARFLPVGLALS